MPEIREIVEGLLYVLETNMGDAGRLPPNVTLVTSNQYEIESDLSLMPTVVNSMRRELLDLGFEEEWTTNCTHAATEAISNAIEHGNKRDQSKKVDCVWVLLEGSGCRYLYIFIQDQGTWQDIASNGVIDFVESSSKLTERGRGLALIAALVDLALIVRGEGTGVILMKKAPLRKAQE